jgi:hypothetical protein
MKKHTPILSFSVVFILGFTFEFFKVFGGASLKSKQKITPENIEHTMGSPAWRNFKKTYELNPSQVT